LLPARRHSRVRAEAVVTGLILYFLVSSFKFLVAKNHARHWLSCKDPIPERLETRNRKPETIYATT
ncbi:MAG: hypothetical protein ACREQV_21030, partial [Candidatus Binatia bacterium]